MKNPVQCNFLSAKSLDSASMWLARVASAISLLLLILNKFCSYSYGSIFDGIVCFIGIVAGGCSLACSYCTLLADSKRRIMNIDNAFDLKYGEERSDEYYTNDKIKRGLDRFSINCFESCFFTYHISREMLNKERMKCGIIFSICLLSLFWGDRGIALIIGNISILGTIISFWIRLEVLCCKSKNILASYRELYGLKRVNRVEKESKMLLLSHEYESLISWSGVLLDEKIYKALNSKLSQQWEELKIEYELN